ncbi:ATP-binding protein [Mariniradius sediminis]|uniref:histidine kinase n=1 Tax=Mariniradius sediminis TaxID=2909237 RepID=A0ABS9BXT2_9BACT|nr:ATP-binding protein [Mariniradius sediminis]MCF1752557.1 ATP-binding protein [Mariniradius sediminis]
MKAFMVISKESRKRLGIGLIPGFFLLLLTFASSAQSIHEQVGRLPITTYTTEEYGGYPQVWAAIQSEAGLMYFGATGGMYEYDGVSWRSIFNIRDYVTVRSLAKDSKGRIFYGGRDFGYLEVDEKGESRAVSLLHLIPEELKSGLTIVDILFLNEFILLRSPNYLIRLELGEDFTLKSLKSWQPETRFGKSFLVGNQFFIRQVDRGLFLLEGEELTLIPGTEIIFGKEAVVIMLPYPEKNSNTLLLGGQSIGFYFLEKGTLSKFPTEVDRLIQEGNQLYDAIPHQGNYILSVLGVGVVIMNPKGEILKKIGSDQGLPSDVVYGLYLDKNNGLWVTTEDGMARISIDSPILSFRKDLGINSAVRSIQKKGAELYLGTNTGLVKFDAIEKEFKSVPQIENREIFGLLGNGDDVIVPGWKLDIIRNGKAIRLNFPQDGSRPVSAIIPKDYPNLLLVGTTSGLLLYEKGLSKQFPWELKGKVPGIGPISNYFFEGKDGSIFTSDQGKLYALKIEVKGVEPIGNQVIKSTVFDVGPSDSFSKIDGEFYMTSPQGMQKYSSEEKKFVATEDFSVVEKDLYDFNMLNSGILWFESSDKKKYILKRNTEGKFVKDERPNSITPYLSQVDFIDEDSILWFGSPKGLIRYDPKKDNQTDKEFFTLIRRIETKTDTIPLPFYGRNKGLAPVERKENSYRFEFAAPYFEDEKKTKYQTYLEGFDPDWVDWIDNKFKEYTNLPPGPYTFHVRALAHTGRISEEAVYSFVVLPPWYATWWAYLLYALLIGGIITAIVKWRSQKLKAENRILEERVNERTAALEKSLADLKSTQSQLIHAEKMASLGELTAGIAHEIQNPLNFVNNFSEVSEELIEEMKEEIDRGNYDDVKVISDDLKDNLGKIKFHGKRADGIVKSMLQHSRKDNSKKELTDINQLADEFLRLSYHGLRAKDKSFFADFHLDADPNLPKVEVISQEIGRVLLNLINNAFYAASEKKNLLEESGNLGDFKPHVWVATKNTTESVKISVGDNGNGIPDDIKSKIFQPFFTTKPTGSGTGLGLSMSFDIVKAHGGELLVESEIGKGTVFSIILPKKP